jgi:2-polyprenyl-3-methyl-5-hydroxy-6-metoxy-1,4-benzoquinol methylase
MHAEGYRVTAEHEATHWWFLSRRELALLQVRRAAGELGYPGTRLRLIDYGCGTGFDLEHLAEFGDVVGADLDTPELRAHWKAGGRTLIDLSKDSSEHAGRFDVLTALDVLEHLPDDVEGLRSMARLVRDGGRIVLTVPAYRWLWSGEDEVSRHVRRYTKSSLLEVVQAAGLDVLYVSHFNLTILPAMAAVIAVKKIFFPGHKDKSNLSSMPAAVNELLYRLTSIEARIVGEERRAMPAGPSLICRLGVRKG